MRRRTILNTTDASLGNVISGMQIQQLPLEARESRSGCSACRPARVYLPSGDQRSGSVSGARSDQSNVTLDGVDVNDPQWGYAYNSVDPHDAGVAAGIPRQHEQLQRGHGPLERRAGVARHEERHESLQRCRLRLHRNTNWSSNEYFSKLTQLQSRPAEQGAETGQEEPGRRARRADQARSPVLLRQLRRAARIERGPGAPQRPVLNPARRRAGLRLRGRRRLPGRHGPRLREIARRFPRVATASSPSEIAGLDPLGIGPSRAVADHFKKYPLPNDPGRDGINYMGYRFSAPIENEFNTDHHRFDYLLDRGGQSQAVRPQRDIRTTPSIRCRSSRAQAPNTKQVNKNWGYAVGYDAVLSNNLVNTFRYGLSKIDEVTAGLRTADAVTFRFITDLDALTSTNGREVPTHNIVNDMSWLKGNHNVKFGANLRFTRAPKYSNASSFHTGNLNPSWVAGTGRNYMPGSTGCSNPLCAQLPAVASTFSVRVWRSVADDARRHLPADGELQLRQDRHRAAQRRAGAPHLRDRRVRVLRAGQLASAAEPDRDRPACATTCTRRRGKWTASSWRRRFRSANGSSSGAPTC